MNSTQYPGTATIEEAEDFLQRYPDVKAIDIVLSDCHGVGRGKSIRRHELDKLFKSGRGLPRSVLGQDVSGDDVDDTGLILDDGGGDSRCWPIKNTLRYLPSTGRGQLLIGMYNEDTSHFEADPRTVLINQIDRARALGFKPAGALELEFYLLDQKRDNNGRYQPARYALNGRRSTQTNSFSIDEIDEMSPFFEAVYTGAESLDLPLESIIAEYAAGQYELTIRYRDLMQAAQDLLIAKRLLRTTARRFAMESCFMAKPFGKLAGSGMHIHLSLQDEAGNNLFADNADDTLATKLQHAIGGVRQTMSDSMLVMAPFLNSWRRMAGVNYSPASNTWGVENRTVAIRVPGGDAHTRHFEQRVAGVDANPYYVAAITLAGALDGIEQQTDPGPPVTGNAYDDPPASDFPLGWLEAIDKFEKSEFTQRVFGKMQHKAFVAIKKAEFATMAQQVSDAEWETYGFTV